MLLLPCKCLRAVTRPTGSGASYTVASRWTPSGVPLRPNDVCGVASWCCARLRALCYQGSLTRAVGLGCRSRYWLMALLVASTRPESSPKLRTTGTGVASTSPQLVVGYAIFCADPQTSRTSLARSIATTGPAVASAFPRKWKGKQLPTLDVNEDVLPG